VNDSVQYWLDLTEYDIETAKAMLSTGRFLYVGFMCHQVIEKALKAVIARDCVDDKIPPKIHDLRKLGEKAGLFTRLSEAQKETIGKLNPLNIEARYPEYKNRIAVNLTSDICQELINETEGLLCWIKEQL
jgi:HEPN domain-containing protein